MNKPLKWDFCLTETATCGKGKIQFGSEIGRFNESAPQIFRFLINSDSFRLKTVSVWPGGGKKKKTKQMKKKKEALNSLVRFEVPMNDTIVVQVFQGQNRLCKVHPGQLHWQGANVLQ